MKNLKRIAAVSLCAALAGTMTAGAVRLPSAQGTLITQVSGKLNCQTLPSAAVQQILQQILGKLPTTPNVKPGDPGQKPAPDGGEQDTPVTPNIKPEDPNQKPVPDGGTQDKPETPEIPDKPSTPDKPETPETPEDNGSDSSFASAVVRLVNEERAKNGLSALSVDAKAQAAAQVRAQEIAKSFSHTRPNGSKFSTALSEAGASYRSAGENIAYGQQSPAAVMQAWMNSSGHRANILGSQYSAIGVGFAEIGGTYYWTQLFIG